jgi:hypothetical protein
VIILFSLVDSSAEDSLFNFLSPFTSWSIACSSPWVSNLKVKTVFVVGVTKVKLFSHALNTD